MRDLLFWFKRGRANAAEINGICSSSTYLKTNWLTLIISVDRVGCSRCLAGRQNMILYTVSCERMLMTQKKTTAAAGVTLLDKLAFGHLTRIFTIQAVREALSEYDRQTKRIRDLPTEVIVYLQILQGWFSNRPQMESLACATESLQYLYGLKQFKLPSKSAISQRRGKVGWEPMKFLFDKVCRPLSKPTTKGSFYRGWLLTAIDGTDFEVEDEPANDLYFDRPENQKSKGPYPQAKAVALMEIGTRTSFQLEIGKYRDSEITLAEKLVPTFKKEYLIIADRLFMSYDLFTKASEKGSALLFRARLDRVLERVEDLDDGSYISLIYPSTGAARKTRGVKVRVIEYEVNGTQSGEIVRLITNILEPETAPADELAALYHQRWEFETMLDELKTHLDVKIIRSKLPKLVIQEIYGIFMSHYAIKSVMHDAALETDIDPDDLSFIHSVRVVRRSIISSGAFPPS
jgi:hypothetical protein